MAVVTSFTTYTGKQSEFRELVMKKLAGYARVDQLGFQLVEDVQSNKIMYKDNYLDKITKKFTTCQNTETGTGISVSSFTLSVANMQAQLEQDFIKPLNCIDEYNSSLKFFYLVLILFF